MTHSDVLSLLGLVVGAIGAALSGLAFWKVGSVQRAVENAIAMDREQRKKQDSLEAYFSIKGPTMKDLNKIIGFTKKPGKDFALLEIPKYMSRLENSLRLYLEAYGKDANGSTIKAFEALIESLDKYKAGEANQDLTFALQKHAQDLILVFNECPRKQNE